MGNCCASREEYTQQHVKTLIKIQSAVRVFLARRQLRKIRDAKLMQLFGGKQSSSLDLSQSGTTTSSQSFPLQSPQFKKQASEQLPPFVLSQKDLLLLEPSVDRVYIDLFQQAGEGKLYKGQIDKKTRQRDGLGIMLWPDGSKYEGMWKANKAHGKGRMTHANGDIYEGEWANDKANGFGVFIDTQNARYEGQWKDDSQHGQGTETWDNGQARYIGEFFKGKKQGQGRFEWEDGSYYEGQFVQGQFEGFGKYYFADLDKVYQGEFRNSNMEGRGTEIWSDGRKYEGDFKNGKKDGEGTFQWPNGNMYIGSWKQGKQHGIGIWSDQDGKKQGEWVQGKRARWISGMELISQNSPNRNGQRI